jgi:ketosteroid isomerase-like protein
MSRRIDIERLVRDVYAARRIADVEAVLAYFHPQATFRLAGSQVHASLPAPACGHEELRHTFALLFAAYEFRAQDFRAIIVQEHRAAVHAHLRLRFRPTQDEFETEILDLVTFDGGLIRDMTEFVDTAMVAHLGRRATIP